MSINVLAVVEVYFGSSKNDRKRERRLEEAARESGAVLLPQTLPYDRYSYSDANLSEPGPEEQLGDVYPGESE